MRTILCEVPLCEAYGSSWKPILVKAPRGQQLFYLLRLRARRCFNDELKAAT